MSKKRTRTTISKAHGLAVAGAMLGLLAVGGSHVPRVHAANSTFTVDTFNDAEDGDPGDGKCNNKGISFRCSLRAAIMEANALSGTHTIIVPPGTYILDQTGAGEDNAATGDLDIKRPMTIKPSTTGRIVVRGATGWNDRIFQIHPASTNTELRFVDVQNGNATAGNGFGGGVRVENGGRLKLNAATISGSRAANGGGAYVVAGGALELSTATLNDNLATSPSAGLGFGGAIYNDGTLISSASIIESNTAVRRGGGIYNDGNATLSGTTVRGNRNSGSPTETVGGGIANSLTMTISDSRVESNESTSAGGGLHNTGALTMNKTVVITNTAAVNGGGLTNATGTFTGNANSFIANRAPNGAGVFNAASLSMANSTLSGNVATGNGGGISNGGSALLKNVTVAGNSAVQGGGLLNAGPGTSATMNLRNSIIANNSGSQGPDCAAGVNPLTSSGHNLIENVTLCAISGDLTGNITGVDPKLEALSTSGMPVHALKADSPALEAGSPAQAGTGNGCELKDQRNTDRPQDGDNNGSFLCDMGAVERPNFILLGVPALNHEAKVVETGEATTFTVGWTVPEPTVWRDLESVTIRFADDQGTVTMIRFDEASNTLSMWDAATGAFGEGRTPGSNGRIETAGAVLDLANSSVQGSGPSGQSVTMNLSLSFTDAAADRILHITVLARGDDGREQESDEPGAIRVERAVAIEE